MMNSRLDWLVLSDYYSIYVTNAPPRRVAFEHAALYFCLRGTVKSESQRQKIVTEIF